MGRGCSGVFTKLKFAHKHTDETSGTTCDRFVLHRARLRKL